MKRLFLASLGLAALVAAVACAEGVEEEPLAALLPVTDADAGTEGGSVVLPPTNDAPDSGSTSVDAGPPSAPDAGADAGTTTDGGAGGIACVAPSLCAASTNLGFVSGDVGAGTKSAEGSTSQWFSVRVTENDEDILGIPLRLEARLVSPPGTNFDLYVYVPSTDTLECSAVSFKSTSSGSSDVAKASFGEGMPSVANGVDDSRTVTIEVRHVSGPCDPTKPWTLTLTGNK